MFKLDSPFMNFLNRVGDIMILSVMVILFSIPIVTAGASITAGYYIAYKMTKDEESYIVRGFWKAFKENFKQSTILWLIMLVMLAVILGDYWIVFLSGMKFGKVLSVCVVVVSVIIAMGIVYMLPMQARFSNTVKNIIKNSFLMAISHLPSTVLFIVSFAVPFLLLYLVPQSVPVILLFSTGGLIFLKSFLYLRIFKKYETAGEKKDDGDEDCGIFAGSDELEANFRK